MQLAGTPELEEELDEPHAGERQRNKATEIAGRKTLICMDPPA
jgi:hypothetical protein